METINKLIIKKENLVQNRPLSKDEIKVKAKIEVLKNVVKLIEEFPSYDIYSEVYDEYQRLDQHVVVAEMFGRFKDRLKARIEGEDLRCEGCGNDLIQNKSEPKGCRKYITGDFGGQHCGNVTECHGQVFCDDCKEENKGAKK